MTKVSVVVPVYNAGPYLEPLVDSLAAQTMPAGDFEVVFVDDGSTDDSPRRLDELARDLPHVRVVHQPNSGWPGKPRNVGVQLATGDFVFFVDQDDRLGPQALERLHALATRNDADIVLPKLAGDATFNQDLYRVQVDRCTVWEQPLMNTLGPHKVFRREFLLRHDLRFPEGRRRLEDAVFMGRAYLAAQVVSIQADYPSYFWMVRDDGRNNSRATPTPVREFYGYLREALDVVVDGTPEGERRDRLLGRYFRMAMIRLSEPRLGEYDAVSRAEHLAEIRAITQDYFGDGVVESSPALFRLRGRLVREGRLDDLVRLADRLAGVRCRPRVDAARWVDGRLHLTVSAALLLDDAPLTLTHRGDRLVLDPRLTAGIEGVGELDVTADVRTAAASLSVQGRRTLVRWYAADDLPLADQPVVGRPGTTALCWSGTVELDPLHLAGGHPLDPDVWDVRVHLDVAGLQRAPRAGRGDGGPEGSPAPSALVGPQPLVVRPYWTRTAANLSLEVTTGRAATRTVLATHAVTGARVERGALTARLSGVHADPSGTSWPVEVLVDGAGRRRVDARVEADGGLARLVVDGSTLGPRGSVWRRVVRVPSGPTGRGRTGAAPGEVAEVWGFPGRTVLPPPALRRLATSLVREARRRLRRTRRRPG